MKKSELRNIIKESIKELMTEQTPVTAVSGASSSNSCCQMSVRNCSNGYHSGGLFYHKVNGVCPQKGDVIQITGGVSSSYPLLNVPSFVMGVQSTNSGCSSFPRTYINLPANTPCSKCCNWTSGFGGPSGACYNNCSSTSAGSCNPAAWSNHANWTSTFTNTVSIHNNPCNFLNGKITQWTAALQGTGGGNYQNMLNCKLDTANQLHTSNNC